MIFRALVVGMLLAASLPSLAQSAGDKAKAREAYRQASQSYDLGEYKDALAKFKEAYRYYEEPSFLYNIAQCHRQLGERQEAVRFFRTYLIKTPNAPNRADVEQMMSKLETELAQENQARQSQPPPSTPVVARPTTEPPAARPAETPAVTASAPPPAKRSTPVYKRWWLWTAVGVVAAGAAVGLAIGLQPSTPKATTNFGTIQPF